MVPKFLRGLAPTQCIHTLSELNLDELLLQGKRLILLDLDHTLVQWHSDDVPAKIDAWLKTALKKGFQICVISNTHRPARLMRITGKLGIHAIRGRAKPSRVMFQLALERFDCRPDEAIMVGDQLVTDVYGANRSGIDAIWVRKMEGKEFAGTYLNRLIEMLAVKPIYYLAMASPPDVSAVELGTPAPTSLAKTILKFLIVGGASFIIDTGITFFLMRVVHVRGEELGNSLGKWLIQEFPSVFAFAKKPDNAALPILNGIASLVAMFNSFMLNRSWTFKVQGKEQKMAQLRRFYTVSISGQVINVGLVTMLYNLIPGHRNWSLFVSKVIATGIAAVWNFLGQRYYAFRVQPEK